MRIDRSISMKEKKRIDVIMIKKSFKTKAAQEADADFPDKNRTNGFGSCSTQVPRLLFFGYSPAGTDTRGVLREADSVLFASFDITVRPADPSSCDRSRGTTLTH